MEKYFYTQIPKANSPLIFGRSVDAQLSMCLKTKRDHVILDVSAMEKFESSYVGVLTRWLRNLKSVGGTLTFTGVEGEIKTVLDRAKLMGACETYIDLEEFKKTHSKAQVEMDELLPPQEEPIEPEDQSEELQEVIPSVTDAPHMETLQVEAELNSESLSEEIVAPEKSREASVIPENSILKFLNEGFENEVFKDIDVSDQLDFLTDYSGSSSPEIKSSVEFLNPNFEEEESVIDTATLFEEETDPGLEELTSVEDKVELESEELNPIPVGSEVVDSGEYQCLGCGHTDYFLKGHIGKCIEKDCARPSAGWHLVCKLF